MNLESTISSNIIFHMNIWMINTEEFQKIKEKVATAISLVYDKNKVDTQSKIFSFKLIFILKSINT